MTIWACCNTGIKLLNAVLSKSEFVLLFAITNLKHGIMHGERVGSSRIQYWSRKVCLMKFLKLLIRDPPLRFRQWVSAIKCIINLPFYRHVGYQVTYQTPAETRLFLQNHSHGLMKISCSTLHESIALIFPWNVQGFLNKISNCFQRNSFSISIIFNATSSSQPSRGVYGRCLRPPISKSTAVFTKRYK